MFMSPEAAKESLKSFFPIVKGVRLKKLKVNHIRAAEALNSLLQTTKTLVLLDLSNCGIDTITMNIIANGISLCRTLKQFHAGKNRIRGSGVSALCSALDSRQKSKMVLPNQSPMKLFLQSCNLNDKDATEIAQLLQNSSQIVGLDLSSNDLSALGVSAIMSAVSSDVPVKIVNLSENNFRGTQELSQPFERALSTSCELEELVITGTGTHLEASAMRGLAVGLSKNSSLTCLNVSYVDTNAAVLVDMLNAVTCNGTLKELYIDVHTCELGSFTCVIDPICNIFLKNNTLTILKLGRWAYHHSEHECQDLVKICQGLR